MKKLLQLIIGIAIIFGIWSCIFSMISAILGCRIPIYEFSQYTSAWIYYGIFSPLITYISFKTTDLMIGGFLKNDNRKI